MEKIYIVLRDCIDGGRIVSEFTVEAVWDEEVERAKKIGRYVVRYKEQNKIEVYI